MSYAVVFPGQGSQKQGMLAELAERYAIVGEVFGLASEYLGYDLWQLTQEDGEKLNDTRYTQPALLAADIAVWHILRASLAPLPCAVSGHSLGEYAALVAAQALSFEDAIHLVNRRAHLMQSLTPPSAMAVVIGLSDAQVENICTQANQASQQLACANYNAPLQVVVAGTSAGIDHLGLEAKAAGAKRVLTLSLSVASHCWLLADASEALGAELEQVTINEPKIPFYNHRGECLRDTDAIKKSLVAQLVEPIRFVTVAEQMAATGISYWIECGPGNVLAGLLKRILKGGDHQFFNTDTEQRLQVALETAMQRENV